MPFLPDWGDMFVPSMAILEIVLRGTIIYLGLVLVFRVILNRQAGTLGVSDLLLIVLVADAAQNGMAREYRSVTEGLVLVSTLVFWDFALDWLSYHSAFFRRHLQAKPLLLVRKGRLQTGNLEEELITREELMSQLRQQGVKTLQEVRHAFLEGNGKVSVIREDDKEPARPTDNNPGA